MSTSQHTDETYSDAETEAREAATLTRMLESPPTPYQPISNPRSESSQSK